MGESAAAGAVAVASRPVVRVLREEEFHRLLDVDGPLKALREPPDPQHTIVVVVEQDQRIVGYWVLFDAVHAEPLWLDPAIRDKAVVGRQLLAELLNVLLLHGVPHAFSIIEPENAHVAAMAQRLGFRPLHGTLYGVTLAALPAAQEE